MNRSILLIWLFTMACSQVASCDDPTGKDHRVVVGGRPPSGYTGPTARILEDNVHAIKQNSTIKLNESDFRYAHMYGYSRLFEQMNLHGYSHDRLTEGRLTPALLANYDVIFLNLVDESRPNFTEDEIEAVRAFVHKGGGLFVIADHTNVYRHAEMTNPLLAPYGIEIRYEICVDVSPHTVSGLGWILVTDVREHPVGEDVLEFSLQTGGPVDGPGGVGFTSSGGWGDKWNPEMKEGYYGNWTKDPDEQSGPQAVVQAVEYGGGRVFVVGDQNIFGDPYFLFLDNRGLALNAFEWLAHRESESMRDSPMPGLNVRIDAAADSLSTGKAGATNHYTFYTNLNRVASLSALATRRPLPWTPDVLMWLEPSRVVSDETLEEADAVLANGGQLTLVLHPGQISTASIHLLQHLGLSAGYETSSGTPVDLSETAVIDRLLEVTLVQKLRDKTVSLASCPAIRCPEHAVWTATDAGGTSCDLLCEFPLLNGRVLLSFAGEFYRRSALGDVHDVPKDASEAAYLLELGLSDVFLEFGIPQRYQN